MVGMGYDQGLQADIAVDGAETIDKLEPDVLDKAGARP
jgi:hypothetical protein